LDPGEIEVRVSLAPNAHQRRSRPGRYPDFRLARRRIFGSEMRLDRCKNAQSSIFDTIAGMAIDLVIHW